MSGGVVARRSGPQVSAEMGRWLLSGWTALGRSVLGVAVLVTLVPLGLANLYVRATWVQLEDGVLWSSRPEGIVVAGEVIPSGPAARAGVRRGDVGWNPESPRGVVEPRPRRSTDELFDLPPGTEAVGHASLFRLVAARSPGQSAARGATVRRLRRAGAWLHVRFAAGRAGLGVRGDSGQPGRRAGPRQRASSAVPRVLAEIQHLSCGQIQTQA